MTFKHFLTLIVFALVSVGLGISSQSVQAQIEPNLPPLAQPDANQNPTQQPTTNNNNNNQGSGDNQITEGEGVGDLDDAIDLQPTPDQRNQGFIGSNSVRIQESGFIGAPGEIAGPGLADDATLGGGVNNQGGSSVSIGTGGGRGGFNAAADNGFTVPRRSVRARLVPSFYSPPRPSQQVVSRFTNHFQQQPSAWQTGNNYSINIQNRTAFVNGTVGTRADSERLVRQLRLEPGVYKIVNQLQILN
jgi:hypothetical protein